MILFIIPGSVIPVTTTTLQVFSINTIQLKTCTYFCPENRVFKGLLPQESKAVYMESISLIGARRARQEIWRLLQISF
jgi:hypothetical protein